MSSMHKIAGTSLAVIIALASLQSLAAKELSVVGTGDGIELLRALSAAYSADNPDTTVMVPPSIGSGGGLAAVGGDKEVLARVARSLTDSERALGLVATPMFRLPSAFFVHRGANVSDVSARQLADIYAGRIVNWSEAGGANMRIKVVRREEADSTLTVLRQSMPGWKDLAITEKSKTAVTTQDCINTVKDVEGAIGFGPYTKALEGELVVLRVDGKYPTDPDYPSAVTVSLVHKQATVTPDAAKFIAYVKTAKAKTLLSSMGGVPALE
jgi:phosphate transport system substrate-binding protein